MCFYIDPKHPDKYVAEKDIVCYKIVFAYSGTKYDFSSKFQSFRYKLNTIYKSQIKVYKGYGVSNRIEEGLHSYSTLPKAKNILSTFSPYTIVKCVIPKGSYYYYNSKDKEYVSNKIKIVKAY